MNIFPLAPPVISPQLVDQIQNEGESASFICRVAGRPVSNIIWRFNSTLLDNEVGAKYTILRTLVSTTTISSTLTIMSVESSDVDTYTCYAANAISTVTSSGVLTVNGEI